MINIQKHVISEAFEQLSKSAKLKESLKSELIDLFKSKGYDIDKDAVKNYIDSAEEYIEMVREDDLKYSVEDWYRETKANYPEDLKELEDPEDDTVEADWSDETDIDFDESLKESKLTEAPMDVKDYASRLRARKAEKDQNPLEKINSQLDPDMSITDQLQVYFDELVPSSGKAKTVAGEIIRALMRLLYRDYNDGDLWYTGYGKETCGSEVIYLINELPDFAYDYFSHMAENAMEDAEYTDMLEELAEQAIVYLNENPQLFTQENMDDSRRHDYRKLSDIFSMPTYDYEPDVSYNPPEFNIDDEEIDQLIHDFVRSELSSGEVNRWARDGWTIIDLDKEDYDHAEEEFPMWFADFLEEHRREDEYEDEEDFEESLIKDNQKRGNDIMAKVAEDFELGNLEKMGTNEYEANKNRDKHIKMYRKFANISDSEPITEETINEYALNKTATYCNREPDRIKAEILGQRYSEYEQE